MSAPFTANGAVRCRAYIEPPGGTGPCPQCSRAATHCVADRPDRAWCGQHARSYDRPLTDHERAALNREAVPS